MNIVKIDKAIKEVLKRYSVYGLENIFKTIIRATKNDKYMTKDYVIYLLKCLYEAEEKKGGEK